MDLYDYFYKLKKENGTKMPELAGKLGISTPMLSLIMNGRRPPSFDLAQRIELVTEKQVTLVEVMAFCHSRIKPRTVWKRAKKNDAVAV